MKRIKVVIFLCLVVIMLSLLFTNQVQAAEDPLKNPNNPIGVHILFTDELEQAAKLVNSNGGEWGYVTIPIQIGDRDLERWQKFMDLCKKHKVIPLVRLASEPDPRNTSVWRKPTDYDLVDFANFLSSLSWPTKNKYVILYNEVNRSDEWGGSPPNPAEYAEIVAYAHDVFKTRDQSFYLILSGMDAAAPDDFVKHISGFTYLERLLTDPRIVESIDGFSSHSYPNPAFSAYPSETKKVSVATYRFEYDMINENASKKIPVFITETGWSDLNLPHSVISEYYKQTMNDIWNDDRDKIVAITPFLLNSVGGPFDHFSLLKNGEEKHYYKTLLGLKKDKGEPALNTSQLSVASVDDNVLGAQSFSEESIHQKKAISPFAKLYFKTILGLL
ncbi:MAG: hypothetical protein KA035_02670 [Candidatus Levybacteria bacterium]|nr:hypothetical protein [Candidatus Levybacteria bacterium]